MEIQDIYTTLSSYTYRRERTDWALLPIRPKYAELIYQGIKKYEYRKKIPRTKVDIFIIYEIKPVSMITGYFKKYKTLVGSPATIWEATSRNAGVEEYSFFGYFSEHSEACAIEIAKAQRFSSPVSLMSLNLPVPQTLRYL